MKGNIKHHYRIVKPVRFFIFVLFCIMILVFAGYAVAGASDAQAAAVKTYAQVTIQDGDNLWSLAQLYNQDAGINIRDIVYEIYDINGIDANEVHPGDTVFIPIY